VAHPITRRATLTAGACLAAPAIARASPDVVKLTLDIRRYGGNAPFLLAQDRGFYAEEGIDITIDGSTGSGDAITRIAGGAYDFGFADLGTMIEFCVRNPGQGPMMVMTIIDRVPASLISFKSAGISKLSDIVGRKVGVGQADAVSRLLPAVLRLNHIDIEKVDRQIVSAQLRDSMLLRHVVDAVVGLDYTVVFNLIGNDVQPEQLNIVGFADYGLDFWGNGLIASRAVIARDPSLVRRITRASARGWVAAAADPHAAIDALLRRDPLLPVANEVARLDYVMRSSVLTPRVRAGGLGQYDQARARAGMTTLAEGFDLPRVPAPEEFYDPSFLPPLAERSFPPA